MTKKELSKNLKNLRAMRYEIAKMNPGMAWLCYAKALERVLRKVVDESEAKEKNAGKTNVRGVQKERSRRSSRLHVITAG